MKDLSEYAKYKGIEVRKGYSIRDVAKLNGKGVSTKYGNVQSHNL